MASREGNAAHSTDPRLCLKQYTEEVLKECTVETIRLLSRCIHCKGQTTKAELSKAVVDRTLELFDQLSQWKEEFRSNTDILQTIAYEVFNVSEFHPGQLDVIQKVCSNQDTVFFWAFHYD